ncbi:hypothetical protein C1H46_010380 [Malus baccata]|uniref:Uncharacterized protein n=1 Tax=Malus baccata TaxID=106549 RepID=A0A540MZ22_MALBA|nr:hypothetical protein C1H46_010380 [Malus baccata]
MAPKRSAKMVNTTKQIVRETVEVLVAKARRKKQEEDQPLETISIEMKETNQTQNVKVSVGKESRKTSVIPIETQAENQTLKTQSANVQADKEAEENPTKTPDLHEEINRRMKKSRRVKRQRKSKSKSWRKEKRKVR